MAAPRTEAIRSPKPNVVQKVKVPLSPKQAAPQAKAAARKALEINPIQRHRQNAVVKSYWVASIYAALDDMDKAFIELENAFAERGWDLHRLKVDPLMNPLRDDPRFPDLKRRIGLPQ